MRFCLFNLLLYSLHFHFKVLANAVKLRIQHPKTKTKKEQSFAITVSWKKLIATRKETLILSHCDCLTRLLKVHHVFFKFFFWFSFPKTCSSNLEHNFVKKILNISILSWDYCSEMEKHLDFTLVCFYKKAKQSGRSCHIYMHRNDRKVWVLAFFCLYWL